MLITGESGTGKELVAKAIHANSKRAERPFVPVNCAAITETLLESELFGHAQGSFTGAVSARKGLFEEADGGTFFFDEIAETPLTFQAKLLRAIQENEIRRVGENKPIHVDVRIIAATNQDLLTAVAEKRFRQDLYYRLNVARFQLPPLRERREDIPMLARLLPREVQRARWACAPRFDDGVLDALMHYDFPGNIRELEHMIEQAVALVRRRRHHGRRRPARPAQRPARADRRRPHARRRRRRRRAAGHRGRPARAATGSRERAAELLGISPTTLWRKMTRLGITYRRPRLSARSSRPDGRAHESCTAATRCAEAAPMKPEPLRRGRGPLRHATLSSMLATWSGHALLWRCQARSGRHLA